MCQAGAAFSDVSSTKKIAKAPRCGTRFCRGVELNRPARRAPLEPTGVSLFDFGEGSNQSAI
jgi:hypothetical protein